MTEEISVPTKKHRPTTKFWNGKSFKETRQAELLLEKNHAMLAVLCFASYYAWARWQKKITLTSVFRPDGTVHGDWRGTDLRIYLASRDGVDAVTVELTRREATELVHAINATFDYGRTFLGRKTVVAHVRTDGTAPHIHLQTRGRFWKM